MIISLVVGDWSNDGHGRNESQVITSNLTGEEMEKACNLGQKMVGIDFDNLCSDYQDPYLSKGDYTKLMLAGFNNSWNKDEDEDVYLDVDKFVKIYLFLVKVGNDKFEYEFKPADYDETRIGGYGLFSN